MKKWRGRLYLPPWVEYTLSKGAVLAGAGVVPILLFDYSPKLGFWWFVLLVAYIVLLIYVRAAILWRREKIVLLRDLGEEQFYAAFPRERRREARQRKWRRLWDRLRRKKRAADPWEPKR